MLRLMFRKILFWLHLSAGVCSGLIVFMMSFTGVILTYERQLHAFEDSVYQRTPALGESRLPLQSLLTSASALREFTPDRVIVPSNPATAIEFAQGRGRTEYLDPYTASVYTQHDGAISSFLASVRGWHRWFNRTGEGRANARVFTGASNLMFLFLLCSGVYLWLPAVVTRATLRLRVLFHPNARGGKARDFNWHHVFGFWAVVPLIVIVATATVFYYPWANRLVYSLAGEEVPVRSASTAATGQLEAFDSITLDRVVGIASNQLADWNTLSISLPSAGNPAIGVSIDQGNGGQPQKRHNLTLNARDGEIINWAPFSSQSPGRQARSWVRFLHTGEALGIVGQTLAGLASLAALIMVWTGLALSLRRLQTFLARRRRDSENARVAEAMVSEDSA